MKPKLLPFLVFLSCSVFGCANNDKTIRMVDKSGKPTQLHRRVPAYNQIALGMTKPKIGDAINKTGEMAYTTGRAENQAEATTVYNRMTDGPVAQSTIGEGISTPPAALNNNIPINNNAAPAPNNIDQEKLKEQLKAELKVELEKELIMKNNAEQKSSANNSPNISLSNNNSNEIKLNKSIFVPLSDLNVNESRNIANSKNVIIDKQNINSENVRTSFYSKKVNKPLSHKKKVISSDTNMKDDNDKYYLQAGVFSSRENANKIVDELEKVAGVKVEPKVINGKTMYKVKVGPFNSRKKADAILNKVVAKGYFDVYVTNY